MADGAARAASRTGLCARRALAVYEVAEVHARPSTCCGSPYNPPPMPSLKDHSDRVHELEARFQQLKESL